MKIELILPEDECVARGARADAFRVQHLAEARDIDLHHLLRRLGHVLAPEAVDDSIERECPIHVDQEQRQKRSFLSAAQRHLAIAVTHLERAKNPEVHLVSRDDANTAGAGIYRPITGELLTSSRVRVSLGGHAQRKEIEMNTSESHDACDHGPASFHRSPADATA